MNDQLLIFRSNPDGVKETLVVFDDVPFWATPRQVLDHYAEHFAFEREKLSCQYLPASVHFKRLKVDPAGFEPLLPEGEERIVVGDYIVEGHAERAIVRRGIGGQVLEIFDNKTTTDTDDPNAFHRAKIWAATNS